MGKIAQIKATYKIAPFVAPYTRGLKSTSRPERYHTGLCPFCQGDKGIRVKHKFWVDTKLGICNCFDPACASAKPMDVINFWARLQGLTVQEAIQDLYLNIKIGLVTKSGLM